MRLGRQPLDKLGQPNTVTARNGLQGWLERQRSSYQTKFNENDTYQGPEQTTAGVERLFEHGVILKGSSPVGKFLARECRNCSQLRRNVLDLPP